MELIPRTTIVEFCAARDASLARMSKAAHLLYEGAETAALAIQEAGPAILGGFHYLADERSRGHVDSLRPKIDPVAALDAYRRQLDATAWTRLVEMTGMSHLMDKTAKEQLDQQLAGDDVPELTEKNIHDVFEQLFSDAGLMFQRGLARCFSDLDPRFKSHDAFCIGDRIVLTNVFDQWGHWNYHKKMDDTLRDIERVFSVLDGKPPVAGLIQQIREDRNGGYNPHQSMTETPYFRVRCFKNGNAHLWMKRDDLVIKANQLLANYYGEVLPDAVPQGTASDFYSKSGLPVRDLAYYPTPEEVVKLALRHVHITHDSVVLEPSAGTGNIVRVLLDRGAGQVDAVEVDPERVRLLRRIWNPELRVFGANFLNSRFDPMYTHVVMNPPFCGTHWMEHVAKAFDLLIPGGILVAILPVTAQIGTSKKHQNFRAWASKFSRYRGEIDFTDLPPESFKDSGTRINTVFLTLYKK